MTTEPTDYLYYYTYDPWGKRIYRQTDGIAVWEYYFYGLGGQKLGTVSCQDPGNGENPVCTLKPNVYFGGKLIRANGVTVVTDRLGSVRANSGGERFSYFPYGEERTSTANGREKFGTYVRDGAPYASMDYADQRYYDATRGRFWTPDPMGKAAANSSNPSSWNRYAYAAGDPVNFYDPTGRFAQGGCGTEGGQFLCDASDGTGTGVGGIYPDPSGGGVDCTNVTLDGITVGFLPGPGCYAPVPAEPIGDLSDPPTTHGCSGVARVLKGNAATIGTPGGFSGPSVGNIMITADGAAIIPEQWGGSKAALRPYLNQIIGSFPDVGASFNGIVDVIGGAPPKGYPPNSNVREDLMDLYPGKLIIELPGASKDYGTTTITLTLPMALDCPDNTHERCK